MKVTLMILMCTALLVGCKQSGKQDRDLMLVDVEASYPSRELVLQDIVDVEYIPLETTDNFICQGFVRAIGKDLIAVTNYKDDGDIFLFDKKGKGIRKINRLGRGGEEYIRVIGIAIDDDAGELFVDDHVSRRILVYDLFGKFRRSFKHNDSAMYTYMLNFDQKNLICYDAEEESRQSFVVISKQDGSVTKEISIPYKKKILTYLLKRDEGKNMTFSMGPGFNSIIQCFDDWILVDPSSDTVYRYLKDYSMLPFLARTPSIQSMDPEVFLFPSIITDRYCFMETVKKEYNFDTQEGLPSTDLVYDKQEKAIFRYTVYNDDYSTKKSAYMFTKLANNEIAGLQTIQAHKLVQAYEDGELKGKLKEIAAELDEEANPVIMLFKHKKKE